MGTDHIFATQAFRQGWVTLAVGGVLCGALSLLCSFSPLSFAAQGPPASSISSSTVFDETPAPDTTPAPKVPAQMAQATDETIPAPAASDNVTSTGHPTVSASATASATAPVAATASPKESQRLFGTIEMRASTKDLVQWQAAQKRHADNPIFTAGAKLNASTSWDKLKSMLQDKTPLEKIKGVNSFWNQWPYKLDKTVYGKEDYWAAPYEFRKNSGDCEDYAITKYFTLKELGFSTDQMRIVVLKDTILNVAHAVLAVYLDDDIYILDNIAKNVLSHTRIRNYLPHYSVNEKYRWVHMRTKSQER